MNFILISKNGLNKMLIIEWVYEAHEAMRIRVQGLKTRNLLAVMLALCCGWSLSGGWLAMATATQKSMWLGGLSSALVQKCFLGLIAGSNSACTPAHILNIYF